MNTYIKLIGIGVLICIAPGAWAVYELTSMKTEIASLNEEYVSKGKVRMVFRDFPLGFHQKTLPATVAANCVGERGKYWEAHDFFFDNPDKLDTESFLGSAQ